MAELWLPTDHSPFASRTENKRVREIYLTEKYDWLNSMWPEEVWRQYGDHELGCKCELCGQFRGDLARDWVETVLKVESMSDVDLQMPGKPRKPLREGETIEYRRVDAARTRIRQFEAGQDQFAWVLVGLETTIAERRNRPYPAGAYNSQRTLFT